MAGCGLDVPRNAVRRRLRRANGTNWRARQQLEWLADISTDHEQRLNRILREEAKAREAADRERQLREGREFDEEEWDSSKHPRTGRPPNPGWFAATGGGTGGGSGSGEPDQLAQAPLPGPQSARQVHNRGGLSRIPSGLGPNVPLVLERKSVMGRIAEVRRCQSAPKNQRNPRSRILIVEN